MELFMHGLTAFIWTFVALFVAFVWQLPEE